MNVHNKILFNLLYFLINVKKNLGKNTLRGECRVYVVQRIPVIEQKSVDEAVRRFIDVYSPIAIYVLQEDPDLLFAIIVEGSWQKPYQRGIAGQYALWGLQIPSDILVFTKGEFEQGLGDITSLTYKIKNEGKLAYARA